MFSLIKQVFIVLLSFGESLAKVSDWTKCLFLHDEPGMVRLLLLVWIVLSLNIVHSRLIWINVLEIVMSYLQKDMFQKKQETYVKAFNIVTNKK